MSAPLKNFSLVDNMLSVVKTMRQFLYQAGDAFMQNCLSFAMKKWMQGGMLFHKSPAHRFPRPSGC